MNKLYLILLFGLLKIGANAQSIDFVKVNGYNDVKILTGELHPLQPSALSLKPHPCVQDTIYNIHLETSLYNTGSLVADSVFIKVYFTQSNVPVFYSDTISIPPGDTVVLRDNSINLFQYNFLKSNKVVVEVFSESQLSAKDSLPLNVYSYSRGSVFTNYGTVDNYIRTRDFGDDGSAIAILFPLGGSISIDTVNIKFGPNTISGADMQIEIYDSADFNLTNGFTPTPLISSAHTILNTKEKYPVNFKSKGNDIKYYFLVVYFFSLAGNNEIYLANSQRNPPKRGGVYYYNTKNSKWKDAKDSSTYISNPVMDLSTNIGYCDVIKQDSPKKYVQDIKIYPNPAISEIKIEIPANLPQEEMEIEFFNLQGQLIRKIKNLPGRTLDIYFLPEGLYTIKGTLHDSLHFIQKLKKN